MRGLIYQTIYQHSKKNPTKIALSLRDEFLATYQDVIHVCDHLHSDLKQYQIQPNHRIAILTNHRFSQLLLTLPLIETAICIYLNNQEDLDIRKNHLELYRVDYVLCDVDDKPLHQLLSSMGIGIITYTLLGQTSQYLIQTTLKEKKKEEIIENKVASAQDVVMVGQTSGTTSVPKLIPETYEEIVSKSYQDREVYLFDENLVRLSTTPIHRYMSGHQVIKILFSNGRAVFADGPQHKLIYQLLQKNEITVFRIIPASLSTFIDYLDANDLALTTDSLKYIFIGGAQLSELLAQKVKRHFKAELIHTYGSLETSNICSNFNTEQGYKPGSVGIARSHQIKIIDNEICVKGPTVFQGYENAPNDEVFVDGWFRTGDSGYLDEDGYLFITGRIKELINRGGEKVSPYELEAILLKNDKIKEAVVFPIKNSDGKEDVGVVIVFHQNRSLTLKELRSYLTDKVSSYKMPAVLFVVDQIPLSDSGKVQRNSLFELLSEQGYSKQVESINLTTELPILSFSTQQLLLVWQNILNNPSIDIDDEFINVGGDSLKMAELYSEIERVFKVQLPMNDLFTYKTVSTMASYIEKHTSSTQPYRFVIPLKTGQPHAPLFLVHGLDGEVVELHRLIQELDSDRPYYGIRFNINEANWSYPLRRSDIIADYCQEIRAIQPEGPYYFLGLSLGGQIALEIAQYLKDQNEEVGFVILLDTRFNYKAVHRGRKQIVRIKRLWKNSVQEISQRRWQDSIFIIVRKIKSFFRKFIVELIFKNPFQRKKLKSQVAMKVNKSSQKINDEERKILISSLFARHTPRFSDFHCIYFLALLEKNESGLNFCKANSKSIVKIEMNCKHADFIKNDKFIEETASFIRDIFLRVK